MFSNVHRNTAARRARRLALSVALLSTTASVPALATASPASAAGTSAIVDSGTGWSVSEVPGGYEVDVTLASPLPTRDDVPVLVADGTVLGPATESSDGLTLSLTTTDNAVATAEDVFAEWSSGDPISTETLGQPRPPPPRQSRPRSRLRPIWRRRRRRPPPRPATPSCPATRRRRGASRTGWPTTTSVPRPRRLSDIGGVRGEVTGTHLPPERQRPASAGHLHARSPRDVLQPRDPAVRQRVALPGGRRRDRQLRRLRRGG